MESNEYQTDDCVAATIIAFVGGDHLQEGVDSLILYYSYDHVRQKWRNE